jgi:uncharacterized protein (TIGR02145 family)
MSRFGLFLLVLLSFSSAFSQVPNYVPTNGLVGWWPFNGNANDESGNGNNGTVNGSTLTIDRFGNIGKAYSFDGLNNWIEILNSTSLNPTNSISISCWAYINSNETDNFEGLVHKQHSTAQNYSSYGIIAGNKGQDSLGYPGMVLRTTTGYDWSGHCGTGVLDNWINLICSWDGSTIKFYINGNLVKLKSKNGSIVYNTESLFFGRRRNGVGANTFFYGKLDDIGIWNRALTQQEITELYTSSDPFDISATTTTVCAGQPTTLSVQSITGTITALNCASSTNTGILTSGTAASGVSSTVPYTGGNGGTHNGQTVTSTGVTGLTATLTAGTFASGNGSLIYTISGTPSASGTASFSLNIGGKSCILSYSVGASIASQYSAGSVFCASGPTAIVDVTNPLTGKTWMDRNLGASQVATSSTDAAAYGDLYQWGRGSDGHQCRNSATTTTLSSMDQPGHGNFIIVSVSPYDWKSPQNNNLWQGVNGVNNPCPIGYRIPTEAEFEEERISWLQQNSDGAFNSFLILPVGGARYNDNSFQDVGLSGSFWTNNFSGMYNAGRGIYFSATTINIGGSLRSLGYSIRCIKETIGSIGALNCGSSTLTGNLISGSAATGVSVSVPYTAGNGGFYAAQNISSTGVTGLTASITQGLFASGTGNLVYTISGTPSASGTASFTLNIGGQTCALSLPVASNLAALYPSGSVFCASGPTEIVDVVNPVTGKTWMDRNLGATQVANISNIYDENTFGDLYQWGRGSDGHQCRNSDITNVLSSLDQPGHGNFVIGSHWRNPQNDNLWQGVNGTNNPCPNGYRIPTRTEWEAEGITDLNSALWSTLRLPAAGYRDHQNGMPMGMGTGFYWSSTVYCGDIFGYHNCSNVYRLYFNNTSGNVEWFSRVDGFSVRCIKD